jgi:hypothetical protein
MPLILGAQSAVAAGVVATNSCRWSDDDSAGMNWTPGSSGDTTEWTFSAWVKPRCDGATQVVFNGYDDGSNETRIFLGSTGKVSYYNYVSGGVDGEYITTQQLRDPAAWYHIVVAIDNDEGVAGNRIRFYINGAEVTTFGTETNPGSGSTTFINADNAQYLGQSGSGQYYDGYMSEVVFVDGSQLAASDFGEFDEDSPTIWKPKSLSGLTFGSNGFHLDFGDSADLGADVSGNSNDFTLSNIDATDQATDTPTNNFCTMNPIDNFLPAATFSQGNNTVLSNSGAVYAPNLSTIGVTAGKWYWEVKPTTGSTDYMIGVSSTQTTAAGNELGYNANDYGYAGASGIVREDGANVSYGDTYTTNDIMGVALDLTNNKLYWAKNDTWQNSGVPTSGATGTGAISITAVGSTGLRAYFPAVTYWTSSAGTFALNFGGCPAFTVSSGNADGNGYGNFEYEPPSGYLALCTKNLGSDGG